MRGMRGRHGGGRRGGREAARRRGLARVHTGGQERPKSDDEHTVGSLRRESAPGTRACVRSLSSTSPCDGDTTVSARVQTAVSTPCGGSTQGQRVRGHNRRAASALSLPLACHTPRPSRQRPSAPPHPLPGVRQVSRRQQRPRQRPRHGGAATAPAPAFPSHLSRPSASPLDLSGRGRAVPAALAPAQHRARPPRRVSAQHLQRVDPKQCRPCAPCRGTGEEESERRGAREHRRTLGIISVSSRRRCTPRAQVDPTHRNTSALAA